MQAKSKSELGIGVVGCGNISMTYLRNAALFGGVEPVSYTHLTLPTNREV